MTRAITSLQRLSRALLARGGDRARSTDWWMVFVEIAVVVLGILIAFQVNDWGNSRDDRAAERALLTRIEAEARADAVQLARIEGQHRDSAANYLLLGRAIADPARRGAYRRLGPAGCNLLRLPAVRRQSAGAIGQAVGARTDLISDPPLRRLLRRAEAMRDFNESQLDYFRANFLAYGERIEPHMDWRFAGDEGISCTIDFDTLVADPTAIALLPKAYRDQRRFADYREVEAIGMRAIADRVACLRRGGCG